MPASLIRHAVCVLHCAAPQETVAADTNDDFVRNQKKLAKYTDAFRYLHYTLIMGEQARTVLGEYCTVVYWGEPAEGGGRMLVAPCACMRVGGNLPAPHGPGHPPSQRTFSGRNGTERGASLFAELPGAGRGETCGVAPCQVAICVFASSMRPCIKCSRAHALCLRVHPCLHRP